MVFSGGLPPYKNNKINLFKDRAVEYIFMIALTVNYLRLRFHCQEENYVFDVSKLIRGICLGTSVI